MAADDFMAEEGARLADWLEGLLARGLCLPDGLSVDLRARQTEGARAAAAGLAGELWGEAAGIEARVQAAQFVCAHAAAMDWQAEANRRDLPPHARATAQRLARQLMALTTAQLGGLCRLRAERRKDREQSARLAAQQTAAEAKAWIADRRALVADLEQGLKASAKADLEAMAALAADPDFDPELDGDQGAASPPADLGALADLAIAMAAPPPGTTGPAPPPTAGAPGPTAPAPVGAGVPVPPPEPPLNRQQRRALERLRRKETRRERVG